MAVFQRYIRPLLDENFGINELLILPGARQVGKSTLVKSYGRTQGESKYSSLSEKAILEAAIQNPKSFLETNADLIIVDEAQKCPALFDEVQLLIDEQRENELRNIEGPHRHFLFTGSTDLLKASSESNAGRASVLEMDSLSEAEIQGTPGRFIDYIFSDPFSTNQNLEVCPRQRLAEIVVRGGMPKMQTYSKQKDRTKWAKDYLRLVLEDIKDIYRVGNEAGLKKLLYVCAANASRELNMLDFASQAGLSKDTAERYFQLLQRMFLIKEAPGWDTANVTRAISAPKIYLRDTGLLCALNSYTPQNFMANSNFFETAVENFVMMEIQKQQNWNETDLATPISHYRTKDGGKVSLILEDNFGRVVGIEIKAKDTINTSLNPKERSDFRHLRALRERLQDRFIRGIVLYTGTDAYSYDDRMCSLPISSLWTATP
jgi:predicted AAA+ superfamily ATPase